jgi:predicted Zn-dependent protease
VVLLAAAGVGFWQYTRYEWRAAQTDLKEDRAFEARKRLDVGLRWWWRWSPDAHVAAARARRLTSDLTGAEEHLNRAIELQGGSSEAVQLEFYLLRVQTGEVDELAPALITLVQDRHPDSVHILETMARSYILRLRYKPAYACLSQWIDYEPTAAKAYQWRGWVLERLNNHKAATADYHRALELDPDLIPVRLRVAEMLLEDKQAPEALPHLERLYRQAPDNAEVQARLGMCRFLQGQAAEARRLMEAALVQLPNDPPLLVTLANLHLQEGNGELAEQRLRVILGNDPSDTEALFVLASALRLQGKAAEADRVLAEYERKRAIVDRVNDLLKDVADSPKAGAHDFAEIGQLFMQIDRGKLGVYWSERALERDPNHQVANRSLAAYYEKTGDAAKAAAHRRRVVGPTDPPAPNDLGKK